MAVALNLALVACSDDEGGEGGGDATASDPAASGSQTPGSGSPSPDDQGEGSVDAGVITILDQTNAGGNLSPAAVPLRSQADVDAFLADLSGDQLAEGVQSAFDKHADDEGRVLLGSVIAIGCDVPKDATLSRQDGELVVTPEKVAASRNECLAAVTSVALVTVDEAALKG